MGLGLRIRVKCVLNTRDIRVIFFGSGIIYCNGPGPDFVLGRVVVCMGLEQMGLWANFFVCVSLQFKSHAYINHDHKI